MSLKIQNIFKSSSEYTYDSKGNVIRDDNRGIRSVVYNVLGQPSQIEHANAVIDCIYDGSGNKLVTRFRVAYGSYRPSDSDDLACWSRKRDYIGNYEFLNGELHRLNTTYGYWYNGCFVTNYRDYQGNNRNSASYYAYGLPVQGSNVIDQDPYLYGGKEFYPLKGINIYDFNARTYAPDICRFWQPDPMATENRGVSPYIYCNGDPINNIDPDGKWTVYLSNDDKLNKKAYRYPKDSKINVFAHGDPTQIDYSKKAKGLVIKSGRGLKKAIIDNLYESKKLLSKPVVEIVLHSCNTGLETDSNEKPIAQKLSEEIPNAIIKAPNGLLEISSKGKETVYDENGKKRGKDNSWNIYFRGNKISPAVIESIIKDLLEEEKMKREQEEFGKDEKGNH